MNTQRIALVFGIGTLLCVAACGGEGGNTPSGPTTVTPSPRLVQQGTFNISAPEGDGVFFALASMSDSSTGRWEATVDWTNATNELWMWVANGVCTVEQFSRDDCPFDATCPCQFTVRSETAVPKPRVLTIASAPGGTRTLIVLNLGPGAETANYRVMLTPSSVVANSVSTQETKATMATGRKVFHAR